MTLKYHRYIELSQLLDLLITNKEDFSKKYYKQIQLIINQLYNIKFEAD